MGGIFADLFAGTGAVARRFKAAGYEVVAADLLTFPYVLQRAYIQLGDYPSFEGLAGCLGPVQIGLFEEYQASQPYRHILDFLNRLPGVAGYVYRNYTEEGSRIDGFKRRYYQSDNAKKIDAVRSCIENWYIQGLVSQDEYYLLLATLLEAMPSVANVLGTFGAYKKGDWEPRAYKPIMLSPLSIVVSGQNNRALQGDANILVRDIECNILYLDPPYNARQYALYYHLLETVTLGDEPDVAGITGKPTISRNLSRYCTATGAREQLRDLIVNARCQHIFLSYSSEGLLQEEEICQLLALRGDPSPTKVIAHKRYRSDQNRIAGEGSARKRTYADNATVDEKLFHVAVTQEAPQEEGEGGLQKNRECAG